MQRGVASCSGQLGRAARPDRTTGRPRFARARSGDQGLAGVAGATGPLEPLGVRGEGCKRGACRSVSMPNSTNACRCGGSVRSWPEQTWPELGRDGRDLTHQRHRDGETCAVCPSPLTIFTSVCGAGATDNAWTTPGCQGRRAHSRRCSVQPCDRFNIKEKTVRTSFSRLRFIIFSIHGFLLTRAQFRRYSSGSSWLFEAPKNHS